MTTYDFEDGNGPVPAHQHPYGGGWVADTSKVSKTAYVGPDAKVFGKAWVSSDAKVFGDVQVFGNAQVSGNAQVFGNVQVFDDAWVSGTAEVSGKAWVFGNAWVFGTAEVSGNAQVFDDAWVSGNADVFGKAWVSKTPIVISGFQYLVVITDSLITVGCKQGTFDYWKQSGVDIIVNEGFSEKKAKSFLKALLSVARLHGLS